MTAFKALFWKECRENIRWAILGLLALSLGLVYGWYHLFQQPFSPSFSNVWGSENLVLTITTPLVALALGLLQVLPELRRDQWAFLVHRPASRSLLFFGKVIPGICLYLLATVLPLLGLAVWSASPSHVPAPFDFRFTLAGWAAILAGLPFYFAGLLVALRPARWYGSRALPISTALLAPWAAAQFYEFWQVALAIFAIIAILLPAAWGSFVSGGEYKEQTKPARFLLGLTLYPAVLAVGLVVLMLPFAAYNGLSHGGNQEWWQTEQKIDTQGHIYQSEEHHDSKGHTIITVTDLAGRPIDSRVWDNLYQQNKLLDFQYLPLEDNRREYYRYSDPTRYVRSLTSEISDARQTYWYYETTAHQMVGYDVTASSSSVIGYLGPNGFGQEREQVGRFEGARPEPIEFDDFHLLRFPSALYWYDTPDRSIHLLQSLPGGKGGTAFLGQTSNGYAEEYDVLAVAAEDQLTVYTRGKSKLSAPVKLFTIAGALRPKTDASVQIAMTPDQSRFFFWYQPMPLLGSNRIVTVAADGRVIKTETLAVSPKVSGHTVPLPTNFRQGLPGLIVPPAFAAASGIYAVGGHALKDENAESWWHGFGNGGILFWILFFSALGGLVPAVLAWRISLRLGDSRAGQIAWSLGVFGLGIYGVLLLLALRAWPARVPCPNCRRLRVVDREECEHCGAAFARPRPDGTEIFDAEEREIAGQSRM